MFFENPFARLFNSDVPPKPTTWIPGVISKNLSVFNVLYFVMLTMIIAFTMLYYMQLQKKRRQALSIDKSYKEIDYLLRLEWNLIMTIRNQPCEKGTSLPKMMEDLSKRVVVITKKLEVLHKNLDDLDKNGCIILGVFNLN